ncbi:MAG: hypothetical protein H0T62_08620 [Parachlamydiaceae bacterium]|nr:hypothetical protein [Parachlamydiaceae bacterium]
MDPIIIIEAKDSSICYDFFKPLNQLLNEICKKVKEFADWFFSLFECFSFSEEPSTVRIVSYNAGRVEDYDNVRKLRVLCKGVLPETEADISETFDAVQKKDSAKILPPDEFIAAQKQRRIETANLFKDQKTEIRKTIHKIIENGADILCLQEVDNNIFKENDSVLPSHFSSRIPRENCAVAWNTEKYRLIGEHSTFRDAYNRTCVFVDLKIIHTNKIIRVASHHLCGYNLKLAQLALQNGEKLDQLKRPLECLNDTLEAIKTCETVMPDVLILGMDSNATLETSPGHFETIENHEFIRDLQDTGPTNVNPDLNQPVKLDYLIAAPMNGRIIEIERHIPIIKKNGEEWTLWNKKNPSDHLPIGATVTIK